MGAWDAAIGDLNKCMNLTPRDERLYYARARAKLKKSDLYGAIVDCTKAIDINSNYFNAYNERGWSECLNNDFTGAIKDATHAIELNPKYGYAYGTRGWASYGNGDLVGAVEDCKKAVNLLGADSLIANVDQGMIYFINGEYQLAINCWQKYLAKDPFMQPELQPWIEKAKARQNIKDSSSPAQAP